jgi:hypothetical protein
MHPSEIFEPCAGEAADLERRWFSSIAAADAARAECELLWEVKRQAEVAWRRAGAQAAFLENLRDALGEALAVAPGTRNSSSAPSRSSAPVKSAA